MVRMWELGSAGGVLRWRSTVKGIRIRLARVNRRAAIHKELSPSLWARRIKIAEEETASTATGETAAMRKLDPGLAIGLVYRGRI